MKILKEAANIYYDHLHHLSSEDWVEISTLLAEAEQGEWNIVIYNRSDYQPTEKIRHIKPNLYMQK